MIPDILMCQESVNDSEGLESLKRDMKNGTINEKLKVRGQTFIRGPSRCQCNWF